MTWRKTFIIALLLGLVSTAATPAPPKEAPAVPAPSAPAAKSPSKPAPAPVVLEGKTLFHFRETALGVSPEERARYVSENLRKLVKNRAFRPDSITVIDQELASLIVAEGTVLLRVFDWDAAAEGATRQDLAERYAGVIRAAIEAHNVAFSFRSLLFDALYALLATAVLFGILLLYRKLFHRDLFEDPGLESRRTRIRTIQFQSLEILNAERIVSLFIGMARWLRILTTALLIYHLDALRAEPLPLDARDRDGDRRVHPRPAPGLCGGRPGLPAGPLLPDRHRFHHAVRPQALRGSSSTRWRRGGSSSPGFFADWAGPTSRSSASSSLRSR